MRSLVGALLAPRHRNDTPVPLTGRFNARTPWALRTNAEAQMRAMGSVGTLFSIVDRNASSTAAACWDLYRSPKPGMAQPGDDADQREPVTNHLALDIWRKPNKFFTTSLFVETFQQHYELVGEAWWVVARNPKMRSIPLELWPVRPDRMWPVPDPQKYLAGYIYTSPDGEQIPLGLDEVIHLRRPNPIDPYRGIGAVQTILADLEGVRLSAEWNRNFFLNSAEPGGLIQYDKILSDKDYDTLAARWREQHQGVANAHRVAIIEGGQWVDRAYTNRDMQFAEMRGVTSDIILQAFGMPKFAVGELDDVNRATADASRAWYAEQITIPRLERIKQALNTQFLPLFGTTGQGVEFDYESPVPADAELENATLTAKANAANLLANAGYDKAGVLEAVGLPEIDVAPPPPAPVIIHPPGAQPAVEPGQEQPALPAGPATPEDAWRRLMPWAGPAKHLDPGDLPDVTHLQPTWEAALERLLDAFKTIWNAWIDHLVALVRSILGGDDHSQLAHLAVDTDAAAHQIETGMVALATLAAESVVREAAQQSVHITVGIVDREALANAARTAAEFIGADLSISAGRKAVQANGPDATADEVATVVREFLDSLTDASRRRTLAGVLTGAELSGRLATLRSAPAAAVYASEVNDAATCAPCRDINGSFLGESPADLAAIRGAYPGVVGGYIECRGMERCRGTVVAVWVMGEQQ